MRNTPEDVGPPRVIRREEDAQAAHEDALRDEPGWVATLTVELDERNVSAN